MKVLRTRVSSQTRANSISQPVMKPLDTDVFTAARERICHQAIDGDSLSLANQERLPLVCDTARRMGRRGLEDRGITSE